MTSEYEAPILRWYASQARDLPWRHPAASAWSVLVSEIMLQQTPVARVLPAYEAWMTRWPLPASLAAASPGDAVRQWGTLGYPRRAIRLHAIARILTDEYAGEVPASVAALITLPGIGSYTAAAVASFAFGQRHAVLDTNVRRVLARLITGEGQPPRSTSAAEVALAESLLAADGRQAARWSVAVMELGALICTAARPSCSLCPVARQCAWLRHGSPVTAGPHRSPPYAGSDRQCRGRLLAVLRDASGPVTATRLDAAWPDQEQRARALAALIADGLATSRPDGLLSLPDSTGQPKAGVAGPPGGGPGHPG